MYFFLCHSMIGQFGLEGTFKGPVAQLFCNEQGHLQLDQVTLSPVQCFQVWGIHPSLGKLCQCFTTFSVKKLPYI